MKKVCLCMLMVVMLVLVVGCGNKKAENWIIGEWCFETDERIYTMYLYEGGTGNSEIYDKKDSERISRTNDTWEMVKKDILHVTMEGLFGESSTMGYKINMKDDTITSVDGERVYTRVTE